MADEVFARNDGKRDEQLAFSFLSLCGLEQDLANGSLVFENPPRYGIHRASSDGRRFDFQYPKGRKTVDPDLERVSSVKRRNRRFADEILFSRFNENFEPRRKFLGSDAIGLDEIGELSVHVLHFPLKLGERLGNLAAELRTLGRARNPARHGIGKYRDSSFVLPVRHFLRSGRIRFGRSRFGFEKSRAPFRDFLAEGARGIVQTPIRSNERHATLRFFQVRWIRLRRTRRILRA